MVPLRFARRRIRMEPKVISPWEEGGLRLGMMEDDMEFFAPWGQKVG